MVLDSATSLCAVKSSMMHITGHDRGQMLLLPEQLDDYVDSNNPMRFIDELNFRPEASSAQRLPPPILRRVITHLRAMPWLSGGFNPGPRDCGGRSASFARKTHFAQLVATGKSLPFDE